MRYKRQKESLCLWEDAFSHLLPFQRSRRIVVRLPADDPRLMKVEISLQMTGVVSGEFGFVEAYTAKKRDSIMAR